MARSLILFILLAAIVIAVVSCKEIKRNKHKTKASIRAGLIEKSESKHIHQQKLKHENFMKHKSEKHQRKQDTNKRNHPLYHMAKQSIREDIEDIAGQYKPMHTFLRSLPTRKQPRRKYENRKVKKVQKKKRQQNKRKIEW
ncbi:uncharacterized protein [Centruroides vittatus]|uniref:uncharacterized protein n=1 Tax=Centruroides vittatus TaxID=120091 RepID=UPI00350F3E6A